MKRGAREAAGGRAAWVKAASPLSQRISAPRVVAASAEGGSSARPGNTMTPRGVNWMVMAMTLPTVVASGTSNNRKSPCRPQCDGARACGRQGAVSGGRGSGAVGGRGQPAKPRRHCVGRGAWQAWRPTRRDGRRSGDGEGSQPDVLSHACAVVPPFRRRLHQAVHQVLGRIRDAPPHVALHGHPPGPHGRNVCQHILHVFLLVKWGLPAQYDVQQHARGPKVDGLPVRSGQGVARARGPRSRLQGAGGWAREPHPDKAERAGVEPVLLLQRVPRHGCARIERAGRLRPLLLEEPRADLRRGVDGSAGQVGEPGGGDEGGRAEVDEFESPARVVDETDILGLEVTVGDAVRVQVLEAVQDLREMVVAVGGWRGARGARNKVAATVAKGEGACSTPWRRVVQREARGGCIGVVTEARPCSPAGREYGRGPLGTGLCPQSWRKGRPRPRAPGRARPRPASTPPAAAAPRLGGVAAPAARPPPRGSSRPPHPPLAYPALGRA
eukprot:scaffold10540_cov116-Isochrysis_galbana.AAC.9